MSELKEKIIELRKKGLTYNQIKNELKCAKSTISYHCKNNNIGESYLVIDNDFNISEADKLKIVDLRKNGKLYSEIKLLTGLSLDKIKYVCRLYELYDCNNFRKPSKESINEMQKYYDICLNGEKVAEKFGYERHTVYKYIITKKKGKITKEERNKNNSKRVSNWRKDKKIKLIEYKGGKCEICGYNKCIGALEFHHKDPSEKDFTISGKSYSYERLKKEVDKCMLVCSNCHVEIHEQLMLNNLK